MVCSLFIFVHWIGDSMFLNIPLKLLFTFWLIIVYVKENVPFGGQVQKQYSCSTKFAGSHIEFYLFWFALVMSMAAMFKIHDMSNWQLAIYLLYSYFMIHVIYYTCL